jgi:hypothetical protein
MTPFAITWMYLRQPGSIHRNSQESTGTLAIGWVLSNRFWRELTLVSRTPSR